MTRSSLLLMLRCYPSAFACHLGAMSDILIPSSCLAEPVWAGILQWYLPFVAVFFLLYVPPVILFHLYLKMYINCHAFDACAEALMPRWISALRYSLHSILDAPLPVGLMHSYMTALEQRMNELVVRLSAQFLITKGPASDGSGLPT